MPGSSRAPPPQHAWPEGTINQPTPSVKQCLGGPPAVCLKSPPPAVPQIWCRYLCPWREAIAWAGKHSVRKLETDFDKCIHCGKCTEVCRVDAVQEGVIDPRECHMCLQCVDVCPAEAITMKDTWEAKT